MDTWKASLSILQNPAVVTYLLKGVAFTLVISVAAVALGLLLGSVLALARNYCTRGPARVCKWLAVGYIELFRNTPLLLWIFICLVFFPVPELLSHRMFGLSSVEVKLMFKAAVALILFQGQFEAGHAQGFGTVQIMLYIVLPQAYRSIIPTLLSQVITTIKDSSYLANVAVIELMARVKQIMSAAGQYNGLGTTNVSDVFVLFGFACAVYFVINFALSCLVRAVQKHKLQAQPAA